MDHRGRLLGSIGRDRWGYPAANAPAQTRQQATSYAFPKILTRSKEYASAPDYAFQAQAEARTERHDAATQHARPGVRVRRRRPAVITALVLSLVGAGAWFIFGAPQSRAPGDLLTQADRWIADKGFGIEQVSLEGHRFTPDADIFDALDLGHTGTMLRFNGSETAARILRLPWVGRVQIKPLVPNGLHIVITERTPFALWERDGTLAPGGYRQVIDESGHVLALASPEAFAQLPRVRGAGAQLAAADLHATLALFPAIATRLQIAERIGERRWVLQLDRGLRIHLPAQQEAAALQRLAASHAHHRILERDLVEIDLRDTGLTVRPRAVTDPASKSQPGHAANSPQM